ncbi:hypothetical protein GGI21_002296 [Coemansia aciculifera]|nr:hypothetical protein GGI21_002296 [Coemansia aciculifera]
MRFAILASACALMLVCVMGNPVVLGQGGFSPFAGAGTRTSGFGAVDAAGNSFVRVDQDTRVQGLHVVGLNENSVSNQVGGPAVEANGAVVVTVD